MSERIMEEVYIVDAKSNKVMHVSNLPLNQSQ